MSGSDSRRRFCDGVSERKLKHVLLDPSTPASDDQKAGGAFTTFNVELYREALPLHAILLATVAVFELFPLFLPTWSWGAEALYNLILAASALVGRVRLHRMQDPVLSQWLGSWLWTAAAVLSVVLDVSSYVADSERACKTVRMQAVHYPLGNLLLALINGSLGMSFLHKTALAILWLIDDLALLASCGEHALALSTGCAVALRRCRRRVGRRLRSLVPHAGRHASVLALQ